MRVLLVDDEPAILRMLAAALRREFHCDVVEANSGEEALSLLQEGGAFDLLVTDVRMPVVAGLELGRAAREAFPSLRILYISGHVSARDLPSGATFLSKPFSGTEFVTRVRELMHC